LKSLKSKGAIDEQSQVNCITKNSDESLILAGLSNKNGNNMLVLYELQENSENSK